MVMQQQLNYVATLYRVESEIKQLHEDHGYNNLAHPVIWVFTPGEKYGLEWIDHASAFITKQWEGLSPRFVGFDIALGYPSMNRGDCNYLWFFFFADRLEPRSELFKRWAEQYHDVLRDMPPILVKWYSENQLSSGDNSIYDDTDDCECIAGHKCRILPLEDPDLLFSSSDREKFAPLDVMTLQAYCSMQQIPYQQHWQEMMTGLLGDLLAEVQRIPKITPSIGEALLTVFEMHSVMSKWDGLCKKAEEVRALPQCDGPVWSQTIHDALIDCILEAKYRIWAFSKKNFSVCCNDGGQNAARYAAPFAEFQKLSDRVSELSETLARELTARGEKTKATFIKDTVKAGSESLQVILYGPFSSGKTTFVNTLLSLKESEMLPVKGSPTTSTLNLIQYGDQSLFEPTFNSSIESMTLVGEQLEANSNYYRVHRAEMEALVAWIEDGKTNGNPLFVQILREHGEVKQELKESHLDAIRKFTKRRSETLVTTELKESHLDALRKLLKDEKCNVGVDIGRVRDEGIPLVVSGISFSGHYDSASFEELEKLGPKAILMIKMIKISRRHSQLSHLTIVDTPGVDSCIPFHRTISRSYIESHPDSPVIYFIDGKRAGGTTDKRSIESLIKVSADTDTHLTLEKRTFFLVTKRNDIRSLPERQEVLDKAREVIKECGWNDVDLHLVDCIAAAADSEDSDWKNFCQSLRGFVSMYQSIYLDATIKKFISSVKNWLAEGKKKMEELENSLDDRKKRREVRALFCARLKSFLTNEFAKRCEKILSNCCLFTNGSRTLEEAKRDVVADLYLVETKAFREAKKDQKVSEIKSYADSLLDDNKSWTAAITANVSKYGKELGSRIKNFVDEAAEESTYQVIKDDLQMIKIEICGARPNFVPILWEGVVSARDSSNKIACEYLWNWFTQGLEAYRDRIISALGNMVVEAEQTTLNEFNKICRDYKAKIEAVIETLEGLSRSGLSSDGDQESDNIEVEVNFYQQWDRCLAGAFPEHRADVHVSPKTVRR